jgi:hypothetical protein
MLKLFLILFCIGNVFIRAQTNNRRAQSSAVTPSTNLPSDPMMQSFLAKLESSLKAPAGSSADQLKSLLFNKLEFGFIHEQTYQTSPGPKDLATFDQLKNTIESEFAHFRDSTTTVQLLQLTERRGDGNLRAMIPTLKFTINQDSKILRLVLIKYNQEYKIMMIDQ